MPFSPNTTRTGFETTSPSDGEMMYALAPAGAALRVSAGVAAAGGLSAGAGAGVASRPPPGGVDAASSEAPPQGRVGARKRANRRRTAGAMVGLRGDPAAVERGRSAVSAALHRAATVAAS